MSKGNFIDPARHDRQIRRRCIRSRLPLLLAGPRCAVSEERVEGYRISSKAWNATRFMLQYASFRSAAKPATLILLSCSQRLDSQPAF
jgi:valyl-tRNA synthetase